MDVKSLRRTVAWALAFTAIWLAFMIVAMLKSGPVSTLEEAVIFVLNIDLLYILTYINAVLVTITVTAFYIRLYRGSKILSAKLSFAGLFCVPVYAVINLAVYLSQITVVPYLRAMTRNAVNPELHQRIMAQFVQAWSGSTMAVLNQSAYAVLGVPSIIFGWYLLKNKAKFGGVLLALNGIACIIGLAGTISGNDFLAIGSVAGGALFLVALVAVILETKAMAGPAGKECVLI